MDTKDVEKVRAGETKRSELPGVALEIFDGEKWLPLVEPDAVLLSAEKVKTVVNAVESCIRAGTFDRTPLEALGKLINSTLYLKECLTERAGIKDTKESGCQCDGNCPSKNL